MTFLELRDILFKAIVDIEKPQTIQEVISDEINGKTYNPAADLDMLHTKLKELAVSDKLVKFVLHNDVSKIDQLYGNYAILDYYMIFLGFTFPVGGVDWLTKEDELRHWYKVRIHQTNYGRIAIKHLFGSIYEFKIRVAQVCENWLFSQWKFFVEDETNKVQIDLLKKQICSVKNARLTIDANVIKDIFEFKSKDFAYKQDILNFLNQYNFEIAEFEKALIVSIEIFGAEYRKRLDNCYELIFT